MIWIFCFAIFVSEIVPEPDLSSIPVTEIWHSFLTGIIFMIGNTSYYHILPHDQLTTLPTLTSVSWEKTPGSPVIIWPSEVRLIWPNFLWVIGALIPVRRPSPVNHQISTPCGSKIESWLTKKYSNNRNSTLCCDQHDILSSSLIDILFCISLMKLYLDSI